MVEFRTSVQRDVQAAGHTRCDDSFVGSSPKSTSASPPASPSSSSARKALLPARARLPPSPPDGLPLRAEVEKSSALDSVLEKRRRGGGLEGGGGGASHGTRGLVESGTASQSGGTPRLWTRLVSGVEMERRCLRRCLGSVSEVSRKCPGRVTSPAKRATRPTGRWRAARPARRARLAAARLAARARSPLRRRTAGTSPPRRPACLRHGHAPVSAGKTASARATRKRVRRNTAEHRYSRALSSASWRTGYAASLGQHAAAPRVIAVEAVLGEGAPGQEGEGVKRRA